MTGRVPLLLAAALAVSAAGCGAFRPGQVGGDAAVIPPRPSAHSVRVENLVVKSDTEFSPGDPLVADLARLRADVTSSLNLPPTARDVTVYLFADEPSYRRYLEFEHPGLPPRRAYFVGTAAALRVYAFVGDRTAEDLRHETVHGLLHASLPGVPLWLDEGLAEYFETPAPGGVNGDYPEILARELAEGRRPDLARLETLTDFAALTRRDYAESWAWVHFLMSGDRAVLLGHLASLDARGEPPVSLSRRLAADRGGDPTPRLAAHVAGLLGTGVLHAGR